MLYIYGFRAGELSRISKACTRSKQPADDKFIYRISGSRMRNK